MTRPATLMGMKTVLTAALAAGFLTAVPTPTAPVVPDRVSATVTTATATTLTATVNCPDGTTALGFGAQTGGADAVSVLSRLEPDADGRSASATANLLPGHQVPWSLTVHVVCDDDDLAARIVTGPTGVISTVTCGTGEVAYGTGFRVTNGTTVAAIEPRPDLRGFTVTGRGGIAPATTTAVGLCARPRFPTAPTNVLRAVESPRDAATGYTMVRVPCVCPSGNMRAFGGGFSTGGIERAYLNALTPSDDLSAVHIRVAHPAVLSLTGGSGSESEDEDDTVTGKGDFIGSWYLQ